MIHTGSVWVSNGRGLRLYINIWCMLEWEISLNVWFSRQAKLTVSLQGVEKCRQITNVCFLIFCFTHSQLQLDLSSESCLCLSLYATGMSNSWLVDLRDKQKVNQLPVCSHLMWGLRGFSPSHQVSGNLWGSSKPRFRLKGFNMYSNLAATWEWCLLTCVFHRSSQTPLQVG